jgi:hypothetical protein
VSDPPVGSKDPTAPAKPDDSRIAAAPSDYVTGATLFVDGGMTLYPGFATGG